MRNWHLRGSFSLTQFTSLTRPLIIKWDLQGAAQHAQYRGVPWEPWLCPEFWCQRRKQQGTGSVWPEEEVPLSTCWPSRAATGPETQKSIENPGTFWQEAQEKAERRLGEHVAPHPGYTNGGPEGCERQGVWAHTEDQRQGLTCLPHGAAQGC